MEKTDREITNQFFTTQSILLAPQEKKAFENIVGKGESAGNQKCNHNVFYSLPHKFQFLHQNYFDVCKCIEFG